MDIMGPMQVESLGGKKYAYVVVDDFSRFTCVRPVEVQEHKLEFISIK